MKVSPLLLSVLFLAGCGSMTSTSSESDTNTPTLPGGEVATEASGAQDATVWLIDMKHTIVGVPFEAGTGMMQALLGAGAREIRVGGISPDPADASYQRASRLFIKMPKDPGARTSLVKVMSQQSGRTVADTGGEWVPMEFGS